jgi:sarcosine oxidase subunit beta
VAALRNPGWAAFEVSMAGRRLYDDLARDLPVPFEFRAEGGLIYFTTPEQGRVFAEFVARRRDDGLDMELIDGAEVRRQVGPIRPDVLGASFCANDAQINTPTVVAALAAGAGPKRISARRHRHRWPGPATGSWASDGRRTIRAAWSSLRPAWTHGCWPPGPRDARGHGASGVGTCPPARHPPVVYGPRGQAVQPVPGPALVGRARVPRPEIESGRWMLQLLSQRANGEVLLGCPMDYPPEVTHEVTLSGLRDTATAISEDFPGLRDVGIDRVWAGVLPFTSDLVPIIDEVAPGLFVAAGHVFGNASGPMTGKLVAQLLLGKEPDVDMTECRWGRDLEPIAPGASVHR